MGTLFEVDNDTHGVGRILTGANAADKRVVRQHFAGNALQDAVDFRALNIHDQPAGVVQHKMLVFHRVVALKGDACVAFAGQMRTARNCAGEAGLANAAPTGV